MIARRTIAINISTLLYAIFAEAKIFKRNSARLSRELVERPCRVAQILAARGLAKAAVLLTPAAPNGVCSLTLSVLWSFAFVMLPSVFQRPMKLCYPMAVFAMLKKLPKAQRREVYSKLVHESGKAACEIGFSGMREKWALASTVESISCPLLVIAGEDDRITPASVVKKVADKYEKQAKPLKYNVYEKHAHWVIGEPGWEKIAGDVHDWLIDSPARPGANTLGDSQLKANGIEKS